MNSANILSSASILETLEKALPDPFFIIDSNGFYLEVLGGAENLLYDSVKYLKGKNLREVMSEENSDYFIDIINRAINEKKIQIVEYSLSSADCFGNPMDGPPEPQWFEGRVYPVDDFSGETGGAVVWVALNITERKKAEAEKDELIERLEKAIEEINLYKKLLPICSYCKKIRDKEDKWHSFESYLHKNSDISFSHGICPDCKNRLYSELNLKGKQE
jgi:PAS domain S-box-containing protein